MPRVVKFNIDLQTNANKVAGDVTVNASTMQRAIDAVAKSANKANESFRKWGKLSSITVSIQNCSNAVGQLSSLLSGLTGEYSQFTAAMRAANTMAGKTGEDFDRLKDSVSALSREIPVARDALASGLYQVISNGVPEDNWIEYLRTSARSAVGGIADLNQVVGVTSTIIKNYGLEWNAAQEIQDKIQLTAKNGVTSFEQLSAALPRVAGNAAILGVSVNELMATFATLTGVSGNTAEVSTQLAAVFTALVKPSSEATKMAAEMGIQFDAAAIKAAGGMQNFLKSLDTSVKAYSKASGVLEQEVYGKLFGSAEALRALVPLQGELAEKFVVNVNAMADSAGTMDEAFADMSATGGSASQMLKNQIAWFSDWIASVTAGYQPLINLASGGLQTVTSLAMLSSAIKTLGITQKVTLVSSKALMLVSNMMPASMGRAAAAVRILSASMSSGVYSATALKIAIRSLIASTVVGIAIAALGYAIEKLCFAADDAADALGKINGTASDTAVTYGQMRAAMDANIAKLKEFNGTKEQEKALVEEMNATYGRTMGYFSSVADWYKALTRNSEAYCKQLVIEAQTRKLADQIADLEQQKYNLRYDANGKTRMYSSTPNTRKTTEWKQDASGQNTAVEKIEILPSDKEVAQGKLADLNRRINALQKRLTGEQKKLSTITLPVVGSPTPPALTPAPGLTASASARTPRPETYKMSTGQPLGPEREDMTFLTNFIKEGVEAMRISPRLHPGSRG